ncbi:hypothetical protein N7490_008513 [Penicillium lividum]|nr:hypothetical protein N7490_008513 [Penicillium lividum]
MPETAETAIWWTKRKPPESRRVATVQLAPLLIGCLFDPRDQSVTVLRRWRQVTTIVEAKRPAQGGEGSTARCPESWISAKVGASKRPMHERNRS